MQRCDQNYSLRRYCDILSNFLHLNSINCLFVTRTVRLECVKRVMGLKKQHIVIICMSIMNLKILGCEGKIILLLCRSKVACDLNCFQNPTEGSQLFLRFQTLFNLLYYFVYIVQSLFVFVHYFNCFKMCYFDVFKHYSSLCTILTV